MSSHVTDGNQLCHAEGELSPARPLILVVDDHEAGRYMKSRLLRQHGFEVIHAATGSEALELVSGRRPQLVCLDVRLPDISGFEVCRRIKSDPQTCAIMVLHVSATCMGDEQKVHGLRSGADTYLTEPVEPDLLIATVEALLRLQRAEDALRRSAAEWQTTFDAMGDGIAVIDADDQVLKCNQAFAGIANRSWSEVIGADVATLLQPSLNDAGGTRLRHVRASGVRQQLLATLHNRHYDVTVEPVLDDGQTVALVLVMRDVTEATAAKQALQQQARLLDLAHDSILVRDPAGVITFWNQGAERTYGWSASEAVGQSSHSLLGTIFPKPLHEIHAELSQYGYWQGELIHHTRDGLSLAVLSRWVIHHDEKHEQESILEINTDTTERKQAHDELVELYHRAQAQEEELRLQQEQLVQAGKLATLGEMATGLAHELNNPLNNIGLFIGNALDRLAHRSADLEAVMTCLRQAQDEVHRGANIITHLRQFGLGDQGHRTLESIQNLIAGPLSRLQLHYPFDDIQVVEEYGAPSLILGNRMQLEQALFNVLQNAVEAVLLMPVKEIRIRTAPREDAVEIFIKDSGTGIPAGLEQRIFDPFFTTKDVGRGTGLGLSIAYSIIKAHGGTITVLSPPGNGAGFQIVLPRATEQPA